MIILVKFLADENICFQCMTFEMVLDYIIKLNFKGFFFCSDIESFLNAQFVIWKMQSESDLISVKNIMISFSYVSFFLFS